MPNWCSNTIAIEGPTDKIRALWEAAQAQEGLLEAMVPIGEWDYGTAVDAWGTKWDISLEGLQLIDNDNGRAMITGYADSAWSPPIEAFATYCGLNDDVNAEIRYFEPGMCFIGIWTDYQGEQTWDQLYEKLETTEEEDPQLYELMEEFNVWDWYDFDDEEDETVGI